MTIVRIVRCPEGVPEGSMVTGRDLVVLADDMGHRAVPLWLRVPKQMWRLLDRPAQNAEDTEDVFTVGVLEETVARLLHAAGARVHAVDIEPASDDVRELRSDTATARAVLATAAGTRDVLVSAGYGLALAAAARAPVRVADAVMDRLAVPVQNGDVLTPFLPPVAAQPRRHPGLRRRPEPRNMTFADGLDYWELAGDFPGDGQPHWQDYSATAEDRSAVLASAVQEPAGFAVLVQTIDASDFQHRTVTFRGELRTVDVVGQAGLHLAAGAVIEPPGAHLRDRGNSSPTAPGSSDWTSHEVTMPVPHAGVIRFGISLTGRGRIELRNAELIPAASGTEE